MFAKFPVLTILVSRFAENLCYAHVYEYMYRLAREWKLSGSGALKNGLNHGRAGVAAQHKKEDTLHVANHHSYEKATLNSKSNPIEWRAFHCIGSDGG